MARYDTPVIPQIAKAFENDPRTRLAQSMIAQGTAGSPLAQGSWAVPDGIAKAIQAIAGALVQKKQQKKYAEQQEDYRSLVARALQGATEPSPAQVPVAPPMPQAPALAAPFSAPPEAAGAPGAGLPPPMPATTPQAPPPAQFRGPVPIPSARVGSGQFNGPVPIPLARMAAITANTESRNRDRTSTGAVVTSPKGAKGRMQVMDGTNSDPGYGVRPAQNDSLEERARVGNDYLAALNRKYGDPAKAWAAYNGGPGRVDRAVAQRGPNWLRAMPKETRDYVAKNMAALGSDGGSDVAPEMVVQASKPFEMPQSETPDPAAVPMPQRPNAPDNVQSRHLKAGRALLDSGNPYALEQAMNFVDQGMSEQNANDEAASGRRFNLDRTGYEAALNDFYNASSQARGATYAKQDDERRFKFQDQQAEKLFGRQMTMQEREFAQSMRKAGFDRQTQYGLAEMNNNADLQRTLLTINGKHEDAATKAAQRQQAFLSTPAGAKLFEASALRQQNNDSIIDQLKQFKALNAGTGTGGFALNTPGMAGALGIANRGINAMNKITNLIAPKLREAGSGAMSDKDLALFRDSLPSTTSQRVVNDSAVDRLVRSMERTNDFERSRMNSFAEGTQNTFLNEWNVFKEKVPVASGKTFDEWRSSLRTVK